MTVRMQYDASVDALAIELRQGARVARTVTVAPGVTLDFDTRERLVSIEVLDASSHIQQLDLAQLPPSTEYLTLAEAAEASGLSPATLRVQINRGRLRGVKRGRDWLVDATALFNYLESRDARGRRAVSPKGRSGGGGARKRPSAAA